jgi:30S ribosomal protein 3
MQKTKNLKYSFKIIASNTYIGVAIDKIQPNLSDIPISSFYFWPKEDGWNLVKSELQKNSLISLKDQEEILNSYTNLILYWCLEKNLQTFNKFYKIFNFIILATI